MENIPVSGRTVAARGPWGRRAVAVSAACLLAVGVGAAARLEWVLTPKHAYVVLPASTMTTGDVQAVQWSPDGAFLLLAATTPPAQVDDILSAASARSVGTIGVSLLVWDRRTRHVRKLWSTNDPTVHVQQIVWLRGSSSAYIVLDSTTEDPYREVFGLLALDVSDGNFSWLPGTDQLDEAPTIVASPRRPLAVAVFKPPQSTANLNLDESYWTLGARGQVVKRQITQIDWSRLIVWAADGSKWYVQTPKLKSKPASLAEVADNGALTPVTVALYAEPTKPDPELWLHDKALVATQRKVRKTFLSLWLSSPEVTFHPDVLLTADSKQSELSPTGDAVYYVDGGVAKVRPLVQLSDDQKRDLFDAVKKEAISNAKQCALGLLMYSNDADDLLPPGGGFEFVEPYIKNDDVMADFMYTPPSELNTGKIANPTATPIGYINGPGGQAIAYADGHVVWIPSP